MCKNEIFFFIFFLYLLALIGMDVFKRDQWLFRTSEDVFRKSEYFVYHKTFFKHA